MEEFTHIYKILTALKNAMDCPEFKLEQISAEKLKISEERRNSYLRILTEDGYISGVNIFKDVTGETCVVDNGAAITIKGLEYLNENSLMKKAHNLATGIKDLLPL